MYLLIISYSLIGINFINNFLHILKYLLPFSLVLVLLSIVNGGKNIKKLLLGLYRISLKINSLNSKSLGCLRLIEQFPFHCCIR